jgi:hypothetical protein
VLLALVEEQLELQRRRSINPESLREDAEAEAPAVVYDAVASLPADAVVIDIDYDLRRLLPADRVAAVAASAAGQGRGSADGGEPGDPGQGVILFNLRHPRAAAVASRWRERARERRGLRCGGPMAAEASSEAGGAAERGSHRCGRVQDGQLLIQAVEGVMLENESLQSLLVHLTTTRQGFVVAPDDDNLRVVKRAIRPAGSRPSSGAAAPPPPGPGAAAVLALQTAADSVCYRYYPKCEVL